MKKSTDYSTCSGQANSECYFPFILLYETDASEMLMRLTVM